jgi:hypothetical protein
LPTFAWGGLEGAQSYELVVYRVGRQDAEADPILSHRTAGPSFAWTPSLDRCLLPGEDYAWSVRAITRDGLSEWAEPLFFEIAPQPSAEELAAALELLRRQRAPESEAGVSQQDRATRRPVREAPETPNVDRSQIAVVPAAATAGSPSAKLRVVGEVRTVDSGGAARLWGRGRPSVFVYARPITGDYCVNSAAGGVQFGLSSMAVQWGSAADACPAGSWVCRLSDVAACDTARPDTDADGRTCTGAVLNYNANQHFGWLADQWPQNADHGLGQFEDGTTGVFLACYTNPVWCCW